MFVRIVTTTRQVTLTDVAKLEFLFMSLMAVVLRIARWGFNSFDEVPSARWTILGTSARQTEDFRSNSKSGMLLDFRRFRRDSIKDFAERQVEILCAWNVTGCITTNADHDSNDVFSIMDFMSYDNYPVWADHWPRRRMMDLNSVRGWGPKHSQSTVPEQLIGAQEHGVIGYSRGPIRLSPGQHKLCCTAPLP